MKRLAFVMLCLLLVGVYFVGAGLYIAFGEPSLVIGFLMGALPVWAMFWLGMRNPELVHSLPDSREPGSAAMSAALMLAIKATPNPRQTGQTICRIIGWFITILFGSGFLLFAGAAIGGAMEPKQDGALTFVALLAGVFLVSTRHSYKYLARVTFAPDPQG